jgi:CRT10
LAADSANPSSDGSNYAEDDFVLYHFDDDFSDEDDQDVAAGGPSPQLAGSNNIVSGSMQRHVRSDSDEHSQVEDETSEIGSGEEVTRHNLVRLDRDLERDGALSTDWADFDMPDSSNSGEVYAIQGNMNEAENPKLHHEGNLSATRRSLRDLQGPVVPTLHLSASHLRLFDANSPHEAFLYCSDLLSFQWPMYYRTHPAIDRLNMTQHIPELGIVVIGTQIGRVAVCSLTRKGSRGPFGIRVDWILPFDAQENKQERPLAPLLGIAVGPVEGHQLSMSSSLFSDDPDLERTWLRNRIDDDGVPISFDPEAVRLRRHGSDSGSSGGSNGDSQTSDAEGSMAPEAKCQNGRSQRHTNRKCSQPPRSKLVKQAWPSRSEFEEARAVMNEPWRGLEYSRRYRLMLTYSNHTVMTYELSRGAPFVGPPAFGRPNWRNRDEPS